MNCLICGKELNNGGKNKKIVCRDCYYETIATVDEKNYEYNDRKGTYIDTDEIITHYYNQKNAIYKINNLEYIKKAKKTLVALALLANKYNETCLIGRIENDIEKINEFENKHDKKDQEKHNGTDKKVSDVEEAIEFEKDYRNANQRTIRCKDGHYVRSRGEKIIDDELYDNDIIHSYEKALYIPEEPDKTFIPDFYLKKEDVYIEFWGMQGNDYYQDKRETKEKFYKKHGIKYVSIESSDIDHIEDVLLRKIDKARKGIVEEPKQTQTKSGKKHKNDDPLIF